MERRPAIPVAVQRAVLARQRGACNLCGALLGALVDFDHIIPRCVLARDDAAALQALCVTCHAEKTRLVEPSLLAVHKRGDWRVCWAGCKRSVLKRDYDEKALACVVCAGKIKRAKETRPALQDARTVAERLSEFRYAPSEAVKSEAGKSETEKKSEMEPPRLNSLPAKRLWYRGPSHVSSPPAPPVACESVSTAFVAASGENEGAGAMEMHGPPSRKKYATVAMRCPSLDKDEAGS